MGIRAPLRLDAIPRKSGSSVGRRTVRELPTLGVPAFPPGLQAHRADEPRRLRSQRRLRPDRRRTFFPGHLHPGRSPRPQLLEDVMIKRLGAVALALLAAIGPLVPGAQAARKLRVVTTIPDLKSLTEAVGDNLVEVDSLTRGTQNFHEAEVRPSMMLKLRRADAVVENGLDLDAWADVAIEGSNNPNIVRGGRGRIEISRGIEVLEVPTTRVDRSMGDVHPRGNPHFSLDPGLAPMITQTIVDGLARIAPEHRAAFEQNRKTFLAQLDGHMAEWMKLMEPFKGSKVVVFHPDMIYFLTRFGLAQAAVLEDRPGIPPSPQHLVKIGRQIKDERIKVILVEPWNDVKLANRVGEESGAKSIVVASAVGAVKGADNYIAAIDYNIKTLAGTLR